MDKRPVFFYAKGHCNFLNLRRLKMEESKKVILIGVCYICLLAILSGCITYGGQIDVSVPIREQIALKVMLPLHLVSVNGNEVNSSMELTSPPFGYTTILLPAGEHNLDFVYRAFLGGDGGSLSASGSVSTVYNFEPGYNYTVASKVNTTSTHTERTYVGGQSGTVTTSTGTLDLIFEAKEKTLQSVHASIETGPIVFGMGKGPVNLIGFNLGIQPIGITLDTGKVAFGLHSFLTMNIGWAPTPFELESVYDEYDLDRPFGFGSEISPNILFSMNINRNNANAFGIGFGIGYTTTIGEIIEEDNRVIKFEDIYDNKYTINVPYGAWFIRGAIMPVKGFLIYFDYYLLDLLEEINPNPIALLKADSVRRGGMWDWGRYAHHPRNWSSWGLGIIFR